MGEWLLSRRDSMIVARHEVPGKRPSKEPSRRVRYDRAQLIPQVFSSKCVDSFRIISILLSDTAFEISSLQSSNRCAHARIIPYPTGRLFWGALSQALRAWLRSCCPSGTKYIPRRGFD